MSLVFIFLLSFILLLFLRCRSFRFLKFCWRINFQLCCVIHHDIVNVNDIMILLLFCFGYFFFVFLFFINCVCFSLLYYSGPNDARHFLFMYKSVCPSSMFMFVSHPINSHARIPIHLYSLAVRWYLCFVFIFRKRLIEFIAGVNQR